ncbi:hypothetical protein METESE_29300 [Mesoterricola sediminis]|uniref:Uncharacterized protein n=1 Tax=Mesoterricola sediminis TaxID=2927980 RepID=A0AA48H1M2_9BACT|nr:hypothetical protein METESE_29300 [Mesoterricola sediminis]
MVGPRSAKDSISKQLNALLLETYLLDFRLKGRIVRDDAETGSSLGPWLRARAGLGTVAEAPWVWILLGRDGQTLASGRGFPEEGTLRRALEAAGAPNPIGELMAFLERWPDHAEARRDLVGLLEPQIEFLLRVEGRGEEGPDLAPEVDDRIWGRCAGALDALFQQGDWLGLNLSLDEVLPGPGVPERASPRMRDLYRRHLPEVMALLRRCPEAACGWKNLLRMDRALGESHLLPALKGTTWDLARRAQLLLMPTLALAERVTEDARATGAWGEAREILHALWTDLARPRLTRWSQSELMPDGADEGLRAEADLSERQAVWEVLLAPWVEACVRTGAEADVPVLLEDLDATWAGAGLDGRIRRLAHQLGRPELPGVWCPALRFQRPRLPRYWQDGTNLKLLHQGQGVAVAQGPPPAQGPPLTQPLPALWKAGYPIEVVEVLEASNPWRKVLGWDGRSPQWAVATAEGRVLLAGRRLPTDGDLLAALRMEGFPTEADRAQARLRAHPELVIPIAQMTKTLGTRAEALLDARYDARRSLPFPRTAEEMEVWNAPPAMEPEEVEAWGAKIAALHRLFEDPLATYPQVLYQASLSLPDPNDMPADLRSRAAELARVTLPCIEAALARRPTDSALWRAWLDLARYGERPLLEVVGALVPSPVAPVAAFPPTDVLAPMAEALGARGQWKVLADLLGARLEAGDGQGEAKGPADADPASRDRRPFRSARNLSLRLAEACLHLGDTQKADTILRALKGDGEEDASEFWPLVRLARELGQDAFADRWDRTRKAGARP